MLDRGPETDPPPWMEQALRFPSTRYQGSKRKLLPWLLRCLAEVPFDTALDAFSGTAAVGYGLKAMGKAVTCNDLLESSRRVAGALVANDDEILSGDEAEQLLRAAPGRDYGTVIADTFGGIYFTDEENRELDVVAGNLAALPPGGKRDLASFAVFQAALSKRPFNLFHRRNLSLRTADVPRSFGNKATWDTPLAPLLRRFADEASASVFEGGRPCRAVAGDVEAVQGRHDLVYMDPPYVSARGSGVDYPRYYHFLEGLCGYATWADRIDHGTRNLRLTGPPSPWSKPRLIREQLRAAVAHFPDGVIALSYRSDGVPHAEDLLTDLRAARGSVAQYDAGSYSYVLSTNRASRELLFIAH